MTNANNTTKNGNTTGSKRGKRRGFTLIEILIVVVILGVLAALVIPGVTGALNDANEKAAVARASQITTMVTRYNQFHNPKLIFENGTSYNDESPQLSTLYSSTVNYCSKADLANQYTGKGWTWVGDDATGVGSFKPEQ